MPRQRSINLITPVAVKGAKYVAYITRLTKRYRGDSWIGPIIYAESFEAAQALLLGSPYTVIGRLESRELNEEGTVDNAFQADGDFVIH